MFPPDGPLNSPVNPIEAQPTPEARLRNDEAGLSLRGIGRFANLVRYYWRDETLNGPTGNIGPRGRRNVHGLIQRDETYRAFADQALYGDRYGSNNEGAANPHEASEERRAQWSDDVWENLREAQDIPSEPEEVEEDSSPDHWDTFRASLEDPRNPHGVSRNRMRNPANDLFVRAAASLTARERGERGTTSVLTETTGLPQFAKFEMPERDPGIAYPVTYRERWLANRRTRQGDKLSERYAHDYNLRHIFGEDVGLSPRQQRERVDEDGNPIPFEQADYWRRRDQRGGRKAFRSNQRRIHSGGRTRIVMGEDRLERASRGDTIPGRRRRAKIERLQAAQARDRERLGITE